MKFPQQIVFEITAADEKAARAAIKRYERLQKPYRISEVCPTAQALRRCFPDLAAIKLAVYDVSARLGKKAYQLSEELSEAICNWEETQRFPLGTYQMTKREEIAE